MSKIYRPLTSKRVAHKIKELTYPITDRFTLINRNQRNLERLRIAYKPKGYHLEKPDLHYWHQLQVNVSGRFVTAAIKHFENGLILNASTSEWPIKKQLYSTKDASAFINLARVLAKRCLCFGITEVSCHLDVVPRSKMDRFLNTMRDNGVVLTEPDEVKCPASWEKNRPEKTWEVDCKLLGRQVR